MPAPWVAGGEARIIGEIHGQETVNVFHFATNSQINDEGDLDNLLLQLAEALLDCAITTLLPAVTSDWRLVQCDAKRIYPATSDPIIATAPSDSVGQRGPTSVSFACSLINKRTGNGGRTGRGRMFLPPAGEADITASILENDVLLLLAQFGLCLAGKFLGSSASTTWRMGVLSHKLFTQSVGGGFDNAFRIITSFNPRADVAVMRSRRKGHGS